MKKNKVALYGIFISILLVFIGICSFFVYYFYDIRDIDLTIEEVVVKEKSDINYNVTLTDNKYYNTDLSGNTYVTELLNKINTHFNYSVTFSDLVSGEYGYYVTGNLIATKKGTEENLLTRELYKSDVSKFSITGNVINISSSFDVEALKHLNLYNDFKNDFDVETDAYIIYKVYINYKVNNETIKKDIVNNKVLEMRIPISDTTTKIEVSPKEEKQTKEFSELDEDGMPIYLIICLEFIGAIILFILIIVLLVKKIINSETEYERKLKRILKKYDSIIVHIKDLPNLSESDVLFVDTFKDLVDASNNLALPINYVEVVKGREDTFIITNDTQAYVYKFNIKD